MLTIKIKNECLQTTRIKKGLSIRNLAKGAGLNPGTIYKLENGFTSPTPSTASKICDFLQRPFDELFEIISCEKDDTDD